MKSMSPSFFRVVRTGSLPPDREEATARASALVSPIAEAAGVTLIAVHDESGISCWVAANRPGRSSRLLASTLESALGAQVRPSDEGPNLMRDAYGTLQARPAQDAAHETLAGADPVQLARHFARGGLPPGTWVACSLRPPTKAESRRSRMWFRHRMAGRAVHYSTGGQLLVASFVAGGEDFAQVESVLLSLASTLPGFDIEVKVARPRGNAAITAAGGLLAIAPAAGVEYLLADPRLAAAAAIPGGVLALAGLTNRISSPRAELIGSLNNGIAPVPARRRTPPGKPRQERSFNDGRHISERPGGYPLASSAFLVSAPMVVGIISPHHGTGASQSVTATLDVPPALREPIGPVVGYVNEKPVHISAADLWSGVAAFGLPGSGKSVLVTNLFAYDLLERVAPSRLPGRKGSRNAIVAFESKGQGVRDYAKWMKQFKVGGWISELGRPETPAVELLPDGDVHMQADFIVSALTYYWGEMSMGAQSSQTLGFLLPAALSMTDEDAATAGLPAGMSWVAFTDILLGSRDEGDDVRLAAAFTERAIRSKDAKLIEIATRLGPMFGEKVTPSTRRSLQSAPVSKIGLLLKAESWFDPKRKRIRFSDVLKKNQVLIVNLGSPSNRKGFVPDAKLTACLSAMLMFALQHAIITNCSGWQEEGRASTIYSDELGLLAGQSPEVILWLRNQGRSYGVHMVVATQIPEQLDPKVRSTVQGFGTMFWMPQNDTTVLAGAVADLTKDGSEFTSADVVNLDRFHAIVRATVQQRPAPPVPLKMGFWSDDLGAFAADQGYAL